MSLEIHTSAFQNVAEKYIRHSYVPYSGNESVAVALLESGTMVPGVRVENASFSLTISAVQNALTTAACVKNDPVISVYSPDGFSAADAGYVSRFPQLELAREGDNFFGGPSHARLTDAVSILNPLITLPATLLPDVGVTHARTLSSLAVIPESDFPVGCLLTTDSSRGICGVNVEHPDWNSILCAERNALSTAITFRAGEIMSVYISAPKDSSAAPCGACRQVLVELAQRAIVWMDRGQNPALGELAEQLLPHYFSGHTIQKPRPFPQ